MGNMRNEELIVNSHKTIVILTLLGDPMIPPTSRDARAGGFNTDVREWLNILAKKEYPVAVITNTSAFIQTPVQEITPDITIYRIPMEESSFKNPAALKEQYCFVFSAVEKILNENKIVPAFFHSYFWYSGYLAMELSENYKVPFVHTIIDLSAYKKISGSNADYHIQEEWEKAIFPKASCIIAITEEEKRIFLQNYDVPEEKLVVTGREANQAFLHPDHDPMGIAEDFHVNSDTIENINISTPKAMENSGWWNSGAYLYMGRLKETKGVPIILQAWYRLYQQYKEHTPPLWIVGGTPVAIQDMRTRVKEVIPCLEDLENSLKICWWGYLSSKSISALLLKTSVLVAHSQYEAGGLVVIEAMSCRVPVIATPVGFSADCIRDWKNGFLVPYTNVELLVRRMEHFIHQPLLSRCLGNFAKVTYDFFTDNWNCYGKHLHIYQCLWNQSDMDKPDALSYTTLWLENEKSDFQRGIINAYPYNERTIKNFVLEYSRERFHSISDNSVIFEKDLSETSDIWSICEGGHCYFLIYLYSTINKDKIWNPKVKNESITCDERMQSIAFSAKSPCVYSMIHIDMQRHIYMLPKFEDVIYPDSNCCVHEILSIIKNFDLGYHIGAKDGFEAASFRSSFLGSNDFTITNLWYELSTPSDSTSQKFFSFLKPYCVNLEKYTVELSQDSCEMCMNYGKQFGGHIVMSDQGYQLLPSDSIFWGEKGFDPAVFLLEYWSKSFFPCQTELEYQIRQASELYHISSKRMIFWCILIALLCIRKSFVMEAEPDISVYASIMEMCINNLSI